MGSVLVFGQIGSQGRRGNLAVKRQEVTGLLAMGCIQNKLKLSYLYQCM